jgi:hypothetical protein
VQPRVVATTSARSCLIPEPLVAVGGEWTILLRRTGIEFSKETSRPRPEPIAPAGRWRVISGGNLS